MFRKLFIGLLLFVTYTAHAQRDTSIIHDSTDFSNLGKEIQKTREMTDRLDSSFNRGLQKLQEESRVRDSANMVRTLNDFMERKREEDAKMKKALWFKGGLFLFMLAVTIVGMVRRRRQRKQG